MSNLREQLEQYKDDPEVLRDLVSEVNSWDGSLEDYEWQENDEYFFDTYFKNAHEAVRAVAYGEYNYTDDCVQLNDYGNVVSSSQWKVDDELKDNADEIIERVVELVEKDKIEIDHLIDGEEE